MTKGIPPADLLEEVIRPTLSYMGMGGESAEMLLLGTAAAESGLRHLRQKPVGAPARGLWQMEPATCRDIRDNFLRYHSSLFGRIKLLRHQVGLATELGQTDPWSSQLAGNLMFACAMARLQYRRYPEPIPPRLEDQAALWKHRYNTPLGHGTVEHYTRSWHTLVAPFLGG